MLGWLERPLAKIDMLPARIALVVLAISAMTFATQAHQHGGMHVDKAATVLLSGVFGLITYLAVGGLSGCFANKLEEEEEREREAGEEARRSGRKVPAVVIAGKAPFFILLYLEILDASFSFDGVIAAFAITHDIVLMSLGLGIGAMYVRSLTAYLVRQGTLDDYAYLEHGALAAILMISIRHQIPEAVTGLIGVILIGWSFWSSVRRNR